MMKRMILSAVLAAALPAGASDFGFTGFAALQEQVSERARVTWELAKTAFNESASWPKPEVLKGTWRLVMRVEKPGEELTGFQDLAGLKSSHGTRGSLVFTDSELLGKKTVFAKFIGVANVDGDSREAFPLVADGVGACGSYLAAQFFDGDQLVREREEAVSRSYVIRQIGDTLVVRMSENNGALEGYYAFKR
jgi:hypothetical protein